jgi:hypothetical protein
MDLMMNRATSQQAGHAAIALHFGFGTVGIAITRASHHKLDELKERCIASDSREPSDQNWLPSLE